MTIHDDTILLHMGDDDNGMHDTKLKKRDLGGDHNNPSNSPSFRAPKRLRVSEPDVIVKVGDQEFEHYSVLLCAASPYFDTMLSIEMMERLSGKIEFANRDPKDWEALMPFLEPHAPDLNVKTIQQLLPWFHELQMDTLMKEADVCLKKWVYDTRDAKIKGDVHEFVSILEISDKYDLQESREAALQFLEECIRKGNIILGSRGVSRLMSFLRVRPTLWDATKKLLPNEFRGSSKEDLLSNPLFPHLISARWRLRRDDARSRWRRDGRRDTIGAQRGHERRIPGLAPNNFPVVEGPEPLANLQVAVDEAVEQIQGGVEHVDEQIE